MLLDELEDCFYDKYGRSHKGALVFVLEKDFDRLNTLGYSQNSPLRSQGTIIFKGGIILSDVYSHELGHFLGLEHTFLKEQNANKINTSIITKKNNINTEKGNIVKEKEFYDERILRKDNDIKKYEQYVMEGEQIESKSEYDIKTLKEDNNRLDELRNEKKNLKEERSKKIAEIEQKIKNINQTININTIPFFKIKKGCSTNFMDYDIQRLYFHKHQISTMREEVKSFYK